MDKERRQRIDDGTATTNDYLEERNRFSASDLPSRTQDNKHSKWKEHEERLRSEKMKVKEINRTDSGKKAEFGERIIDSITKFLDGLDGL